MPQQERRWLIRFVRRDGPGPGHYWARFTSEEGLTPGAEWEEFAFMFTAPPRQGAAVARQVIGQGKMTTTELFERVCCLGSADFAHMRAVGQ